MKNGNGITLITPTCNRPEAFALCEYWMSRQTYSGEIQWIVVDDGTESICPTRGQSYIRRSPNTGNEHSLKDNLRDSLIHAQYDKILII